MIPLYLQNVPVSDLVSVLRGTPFTVSEDRFGRTIITRIPELIRERQDNVIRAQIKQITRTCESRTDGPEAA